MFLVILLPAKFQWLHKTIWFSSYPLFILFSPIFSTLPFLVFSFLLLPSPPFFPYVWRKGWMHSTLLEKLGEYYKTPSLIPGSMSPAIEWRDCRRQKQRLILHLSDLTLEWNILYPFPFSFIGVSKKFYYQSILPDETVTEEVLFACLVPFLR